MGYVSFGTKCKESEKQRKNTKQKKLLKTWVESEGQDERQKHKNNRTRRKQCQK